MSTGGCGLEKWQGAEGQSSCRAGQQHRAIEDHRDAIGVGRDDVHLGELARHPDGYVKPPVGLLEALHRQACTLSSALVPARAPPVLHLNIANRAYKETKECAGQPTRTSVSLRPAS